MKLFNKNKASELVKDKASKKNPKAESSSAEGAPKKSSKGSVKGQGKGLASVLYPSPLIAVGLCLLLALMIDFGILRPAEDSQKQLSDQRSLSLVKEKFNQRVSEPRRVLENIAVSEQVKSSLNDDQVRVALTATIKTLFPGVEGFWVIPAGTLNEAAAEMGLSFANMDLVRSVEAGKNSPPEAFLKDKKWFVQYAVAVKAGGDSQKVAGSLLLVMQQGFLRSALTLPKQFDNGQVTLKQAARANGGIVFSQGQGKGQAVVESTIVPQLALEFKPASGDTELVNRANYWALAGGIILLSFIATLLPIRLFVVALRKDRIAAAAYLERQIMGESRPTPKFRYADIGALVAALIRSIKESNKKRAAEVKSAAEKAAQTAGPKAADDEPLFEADEFSDIDLLDGDDDLLGSDDSLEAASSETLVKEVEQLNIEIPQTIFRAYDIRGVVGESLTPEIVEILGKAIGSEALHRGQNCLCIGYDGRLSSEEFCEALSQGVLSTGCDVIVIGQVPTPVLYFATHHFDTGSGVMITGSHNPSNYNGFKMMLGGATLANDDIQGLYNRIILQDFETGQGARRQESVDQFYSDTILNDIAVAAPLKVVVDAGNGVTGELAPSLIEELGCEVIPLHCEIDGNFPNHHPDPGKPENLQDLIAKVAETGADLGLAFDGDGDRVGVVTNTGKIIWPDRLLMLFAKDVVSRNPGADIIYDVKCSRRLSSLISGYGGRPIMWKTGHSLIKAKMKETGALLAGEMSGHVFFKERWFGFDDGIYSAARLLEILGLDEQSADDIFKTFPEDVSTPEINIHVTDENKFDLVEKLSSQGQFPGGNVVNIDGVRVDYPNGWGLCRASNTTPVLVLRFEADDEDALETIKQTFREQLLAVEPGLEINF